MITLLHARELEMAKHHIQHSSVYPLLLRAMPMWFEAFDPRWRFIEHGASGHEVTTTDACIETVEEA